MKKYRFYLWLIALAGLITSCSPNETEALTAGESNRVSFTASLPADFAQPGTRALPTPPTEINGGQHKLRCILEVWSKDLSTLIVRQEKVPTTGDTDIKFEFELENPADYKALFWADYIPITTNGIQKTTPNSYTHYQDNSYTTDDETDGLKAVSIANYQYNPLIRDAFFACKDFTKGVGALTNFNVTLTRPLAKLTIAEKNATNFSYCKQVNVTHDIPTTLNVATGAVSGTVTKKYSAYYSNNSAYGGFGNDVIINGETCKTLFFNYFFAGDNDTMGEIALEFEPDDGSNKTLKTVTIPAGIPLKRNYCTNAAGSLINEAVTPSPNTVMTVDITDEWGTSDENHDITTTIDTWDGNYPADVATAKAWLGEAVSSGTDGKDYVFEISTAKQLCALQKLINQNISDAVTTNNTYTYATYKLTADINLNNHQWMPLGIFNMGGMAFYGVFDGQGHTISGLNVSESQKYYVGFIGYVQNGGIVKHLTVKGEVEYTGTGGASIGGIAGDNYGTIAFCSFEGTVKATEVNTSESRLGWICGKNLQGTSDSNVGQITSCFAKGTISGNTGVQTGGMTAINTDLSGNSGVISGCTWYYKSGATPEGIEKCYSGWTSGGDNASYSTESELSGRVSTMNQNATNYNYKWEASGSTLKLVKKQ
ncbi:DUF6562 domain-containing protein [Bacteroides sp. GD17]|jgi:hypothetical protein|uniref:DUF6562 domain-containing protein n=1 Tax=Bacteroides sp. GD17 TaxID=3139826 RepID=UPI0025D91037|nr:DUF6562 domain-containing protein [uncultured Bacteroides sp.]